MKQWLARWLHRSTPPSRWCVIDAETSGLNPVHDELIALAGVAVQVHEADACITPDDSLEILLKPAQLSEHENILVHGIGRGAQSQALPLTQGLHQFFDWVGDSPCVGFHSPFDRAFIEKAARQQQMPPPPGPWLDLAQLAPAVGDAPSLRTLDDWLEHYEITLEDRHSAAADAYATAMLLLVLVQAARRHGNRGFHALVSAARAGRFMST